MTTTYESVNVTCPIACAVEPSPIPGSTWRKSSSSATPITISGVTSGSSMTVLIVPPPGPRQRCSPSASATPSGVAIEHADDAEEERVLQRALEGRVVEDAAALAREPARREALPRRPRAPVVEGEQDRDRDRDQRPEDVDDRDERRGSAACPTGCGATLSCLRPIVGAARRAQVVEHQPEQQRSRGCSVSEAPTTFSEPWRVSWSIWFPIMLVFVDEETRSGV